MTFQLEQSIFTEEKSYKFMILLKLYDKNLYKQLFSQAWDLILSSFESEMSYNLEKMVQLYDNQRKSFCFLSKKVI